MLQHIILHLARSPDFPEGSAERGYELVAPVDASGHLDVEEWRSHKAQCYVTRFWLGQADRHGALVHYGAAQGGSWTIHYEGHTSSEDEKGVRLGTHQFVKDDYVSIRDEEGRSHTFKIASVRPLEAAKQSMA
jgi:hypothetical protein